MNRTAPKKRLSPTQRDELLVALQNRFEQNMRRHESLRWPEVHAKLNTSALKLWTLYQMEITGGEPDVVGHDTKTGEYI